MSDHTFSALPAAVGSTLDRANDDPRRTRDLLEAILDYTPISTWVSDEAGTMVRMNQACRSLLGVTDDDVVGRYNLFTDRIVQQQGLMPQVRSVFSQGERVQFTLTYPRSYLRPPKPGETEQMVLEVTISPVLDAERRVRLAIVQHQDITERLRAQDALARANRQLRMLTDCNQNLTRAADEASLLSTVCDTIVREGGYRMVWVGYAEHDAAKAVRPVAYAGHEEGYLEGVRAAWDDSERGRGPVGTSIRTQQPCVVQNIAADTRFVPWRAEAVQRGFAAGCGLPLVANGSVIGGLGVYSSEPYAFDNQEVAHLNELAEDLAFGIMMMRQRVEQRQTEETLHTNEERFRRLVLNSSDLVSVMDQQGIHIAVIGPVETILGARPEELVGTSGFAGVHRDDLSRVSGIFAEIVGHPGAARRLEFRFSHANGGWIWMEAVGTNMLDDPLVRGIVMNVRDISERKRAEEEHVVLQNQLQQAMKMEAVGRLAGGVAHDFNNLLTAIRGNAELIRLDLNPSDPLVPPLDDITKAADSAAALTRQLLAFSRRQIIEPRTLNLNDLVDDLQKMLVRLIGEDIELVCRLRPELPAVKIDPGQFEQVLVNLAVNARDAMPSGGRLLIETQAMELGDEYCQQHPYVKPGAFVMLAVSDTGCGMTDDVKQHLFEPFFTTKPTGRGTGLGLATIFGAVKQAGGAIEVYSELTQGTAFKIYLPAVPEPAERFIKATPAITLATGHETVLLVEDEASVRDLASSFLKRLGYRVLRAANAGEALMLAETHHGPIDLLLTDVVMPGLNGRELSERLAVLRPDIRVLFSSGYTEDIIVHHGVVDAHMSFIGKPFSIQALAAKVRAVLDQR